MILVVVEVYLTWHMSHGYGLLNFSLLDPSLGAHLEELETTKKIIKNHKYISALQSEN